MYLVHLLLAATNLIELWQSVNGAEYIPPPYTHSVENRYGRISGDGGATGLDWPDCTIPYYIDPKSYDRKNITKIKRVMQKEYHRKTCIRFRPVNQNDTNWIEIASKNPWCSSLVGMQSFGGQLVNLGQDCIYNVNMAHELMHAVGFNHQHIAYNRDDYITINWDNIVEKNKYNFNKEDPEDNQDGPYGFDFTSAMMYGRYAFSKNGKPVIEAKRPYVFTQELYGNNYGLSPKDVKKIRLRYKDVCSCYSDSEKSAESTKADTCN